MTQTETKKTTEKDAPCNLQGPVSLRNILPEPLNSRGFTLVELIVSIAIIGVLAIIGISSFGSFKENARVARAATEIRGIEKDINSYALDKGGFPADYDTLVTYIGRGELLDPWGHRYVYTYSPADTTVMRYKGVAIIINTDFDLYSKGNNNSTDLFIEDTTSEDDIIRAGNGTYVGSAKQYLN